MPIPRFHVRTLMVVVAVAAAGLWVGIPLCELFFFSDPLTRSGVVVVLVFGLPFAAYLGACAFLLVRYRNL